MKGCGNRNEDSGGRIANFPALVAKRNCRIFYRSEGKQASRLSCASGRPMNRAQPPWRRFATAMPHRNSEAWPARAAIKERRHSCRRAEGKPMSGCLRRFTMGRPHPPQERGGSLSPRLRLRKVPPTNSRTPVTPNCECKLKLELRRVSGAGGAQCSAVTRAPLSWPILASNCSNHGVSMLNGLPPLMRLNSMARRRLSWSSS